jgi:hypothetical protein
MSNTTPLMGSYRAASIGAVRKGFLEIGVQDNDVLLFSELMDSQSLFLTANCDTVYFLSFVDLSDGPMVLEVPQLSAPSAILGTCCLSAATNSSTRRRRSLPKVWSRQSQTAPASSTRGSPSSTRRRESPPRCACT